MPVIIYNVKGYNYCHNLKRCHKNNNVFFVANVEKNQIIQKCHDFNCSSFSSFPYSLVEYDKPLVDFDERDNYELLLACDKY